MVRTTVEIFAFILAVLFIPSAYSINACPAETATACNNEELFCETLFPAGAAGAASADCILDRYKLAAAKCKKSCQRCCDDPRFSCTDITGPRIACKDLFMSGGCASANPVYEDVAKNDCPGTCGRCDGGGPSPSSCTDKEDCTLMKTFCEAYKYHDYMTANCSKTCNFCGDSGSGGGPNNTCSDIANNCALNQYFCQSEEFAKLCMRTCNRCSGSDGGASCADSSSSCTTWNRSGFCASDAWTEVQKRQYCARTCKLC